MAFKQSMILLFVAVMCSAVVADFEEYDVETLKNMLRAQAQCPQAYAIYADSCQTKFKNDVAQCEDNESNALLKLQEESVENRKGFAVASNLSCDALRLCSEYKDTAVAYECYAVKSTASATTYSNTYFRATGLQTSYNAAKTTIENKKTSCYETCSKDLSDNTNKGMLELQNCMKNGKFVLAPIVSVAPTKTPTATEAIAPAVTETPESEE